ncbi:MAG: hypothetical protein ABI444_09560 [Candidatus Kapaibacterium sp.]
MTLRIFLGILALTVYANTYATTWQVGATRTYKSPSKVMSLVASGDTVAIDSGLYSGDVGNWTKDNLVIRCTVGYAHLDAKGQSAGGKAIWVVQGKNTYIEGIEFSGATVPDMNGAGIRQEGIGLELRRCYFHDNQDGVLAGDNATSDILFEACEFARNGAGDGYSHNMYINHVHSFTLKFCYVHEAKVGHNVKSRAYNTYILYNRIIDAETGTASYDIDLPNGGRAIVMGNSIMKGPKAQNKMLVNYGAEGLSNPDTELYVINNTMLTELGNTTFVRIATGTPLARVMNNIFAGAGTLISGTADTATNIYSADTTFFHFQDVKQYDYRPSAQTPGMPYASTAGSTKGFALTPNDVYVHPLDSGKRGDLIPAGIGAYQTIPKNGVGRTNDLATANAINIPNPFDRLTEIILQTATPSQSVMLQIFDERGAMLEGRMLHVQNNRVRFERENISSGIYLYTVHSLAGVELARGRFVIQNER